MPTAEMQQCIQACLDCYATCTTTAAHCLTLGGEHASPEHQTILLDCVTICQASAALMLRGSHLHPQMCAVGAEACRRCEKDCRRLANGDAMMEQCADICGRCAESCERMSTMAM
ncbi:four-helix bundle copper-binding protein [Gemmatimonas sp.]|uniref:four-helix bundle copper-binding protein n=1 Tax=Gemmatimonas sp. TaxID=1962908 RepID=UPI00398346A8